LVSTCVAAAEVPVCAPWSDVLVSLLVPATSEFPDPACDAADPPELLVSTCVAAAEVPVCGALAGEAGEFAPVWPAGV
jgi:hypothetical protein